MRGFDSSVGRALHRHRRDRGLESLAEPEFFSSPSSSSVMAALASMNVINSLVFSLGKQYWSSFTEVDSFF